MIIAVDFDGCLWDKKINRPLVQVLQSHQRAGDIVILWTCREGESLRDAVLKLARAGFAPNYINQNAPQGIKEMGHDSRKIYADVYLDDKARPFPSRIDY